MKKLLALALALVFVLAIVPAVAVADGAHFCPSCGQSVGEGMAFCPYCGKPLSAQDNAVPVATVSGTAGSGDLVHSFGNGEGIVVLEDEYITVRLMSFYEKEYNWSSGKTIEKCVEFKVRNNSTNEYILNFEKAYIGEEGVRVLMSDGNTGPVPGKSNTYNYTIQRETGSNGAPLNSLDDLYSLEGVFALSVYNADKSAITGRHEAALRLQEVFSGSAPAAAPAAPAAPSAADVDAALQGTWVLQGVNYFSFDQGSISISGGGNNLNGSYSVNTTDSTVDATLSASNGNVVIHLPYTFVNGTLTLRNNQNIELVKN